jgi:hypothetical protein
MQRAASRFLTSEAILEHAHHAAFSSPPPAEDFEVNPGGASLCVSFGAGTNGFDLMGRLARTHHAHPK